VIALDTNVLVRYLVNDNPKQAQAARALLAKLTPQQPGFISREVAVELAWVLMRAYNFPRDQVADVFEQLVARETFHVESNLDIILAAVVHRKGNADFSDQMIVAAARRQGAATLYTFDQKMARLSGTTLLK